MYIIKKNSEFINNELQNNELRNKELRISFVSQSIATVLTFLTASIIIIEFSKNYKEKSYYQSVMFLLVSIIMLSISLIYSTTVLRFMSLNKDIYNELITLPRILQGVNYLFVVYILYVLIKRFYN